MRPRQDSYSRRPGATLCSVAKCPHELGSSPYRYCLEHMPTDLLSWYNAERRYKNALSHYPARGELDPVAISALKQAKGAPICLRELAVTLKVPRSTLSDVFARLLSQNMAKRVKPGYYAAA